MISPIRMQIDYEVIRAGDGVLAAAGRTVHAALDREGRPCRLPQRVIEVFA
jgi:acyl-CoA thioesterase FadM